MTILTARHNVIATYAFQGVGCLVVSVVTGLGLAVLVRKDWLAVVLLFAIILPNAAYIYIFFAYRDYWRRVDRLQAAAQAAPQEAAQAPVDADAWRRRKNWA